MPTVTNDDRKDGLGQITNVPNHKADPAHTTLRKASALGIVPLLQRRRRGGNSGQQIGYAPSASANAVRANPTPTR
jgi:hypothetical protein